MNYKKVSISADETQCDILIALLTEMGYEGFESTDTQLHAYISETDFDLYALNKLLNTRQVTAEIASIEAKNWNEEWEKNFQPVVVERFCTIRAGFHEIKVNTPFEIIITPKMSFGTGHHATTQLMLEGMREIDFTGKVVLDFGTGTGILGIMASQLGASNIIAIDTEEWSCENAADNASRNNIVNMKVCIGSLEQVSESGFDVLLANINRHILVEYMTDMCKKLKPGGLLLLSGILKSDELIIRESAQSEGFTFVDMQVKGDWLMTKFKK